MSTTAARVHEGLPTASAPFIASAPMYGIATSKLAAAVTKAGGFGFIGGGFDFTHESPYKTIQFLTTELASTRSLLSIPESEPLPIGIGFLTFQRSQFMENLAPVLKKEKPAAVWLFGPADRHTHTELVPQLHKLGREGGWDLKVWVQVGTVQAAREAINDGADVIVAQGVDAGGHQWAQGSSIVTLVPEVRDLLARDFPTMEIPVIAAGGIMDGRSVAAALALGADGVVMGTRFVASEEAVGPRAGKETMVKTQDGGVNTIKSTIHDAINGTDIWPGTYDGRAVVGVSYEDYTNGLAKEENAKKLKEAIAAGDDSRRIVWAGAGVGLVKDIPPAGEIVERTRTEARETLERMRI